MAGGKRLTKRPPPPPQSEASHKLVQSRIETEIFSGPIPPPNLLAKYNDIIPNGADRILAMAERQSAHRESLESKVVNGNLSNQKTGTIFGFILCLVVILGGVYIMAIGRNGWGFAAILSALASLATVFAVSRSQQRKERVEKSEALASRRRR